MALSAATLVKVTKNLINQTSRQNIALRAFGGAGICIHCPRMSENGIARQDRKSDIDLIAKGTQCMFAARQFLSTKGWRSREPSNDYTGGSHQAFVFELGSEEFNIDLYCGQLRFNHPVPLPYFDTQNKYTIPLTQLLLSKLAIISLADIDIIDLCALLAEHEVSDSDSSEVIQLELLRETWGTGVTGWRIWRTCLANVNMTRSRLDSIEMTESARQLVSRRLDLLEDTSQRCRKSLCWRLRNAVGTRLCGINISWYDKVAPPEQPDSP